MIVKLKLPSTRMAKTRHSNTADAVLQSKTDEMNKNAAAHAVFDIAELLEMVMLELPVKEQFALQRVSRQWRGVAKESLALKKSMFLVPDETRDKAPTVRQRRKQSFTFAPIFMELGPEDRTFLLSARTYANRPAAFFKPIISDEKRMSKEKKAALVRDTSFLSSISMYGNTASWPGMLVSQPAVRTVSVGLMARAERLKTWKIKNDRGVTAMDMIRMANKKLKWYEKERYNGLSYTMFFIF